MKRLIIICISAFLMSSCGLFAPRKPEVMRYHKKIAGIEQRNELAKIRELFQVNAFLLDPTAGEAKNIFDLSPEGQSALIEAHSQSSKTPLELSSALATPIKQSSGNQAVRSYVTWKKRIVLNITKLDRERANRLEYILFTMIIPDSHKGKTELVSWDKIVTETRAIDLGKITSANTTAYLLSPNITMAGKIVGATAGSASNTQSYTEEKSFTYSGAGLNAAIVSPQRLQVFRQGFANEDISGNIVIELTLRATDVNVYRVYSFNGLFKGGAAETTQANIKMNSTVIAQPSYEVPINLEYTYRYRKVAGGSTTEPEKDDVVTYIDGTHCEETKFNLYSAADAGKFSKWNISCAGGYLHVLVKGKKELLAFDSYAEAEQLLNWLQLTKSLKVAGHDLYIGFNELREAEIQTLTVKIDNK